MPTANTTFVHGLCSAAAVAAVTLTSSVGSASKPRTHDDFYFRGGVGAGYLVSDLQFEGPLGELDASGVALTYELAFGGTPAPGLVVGGASYGALMPSLTAEGSGGAELDGSQWVVPVGPVLGYVGPFIDFYPVPTGGFHVQWSMAFAMSSSSYERADGAEVDFDAVGWTAMFGLGYDFWVDDEWSLGALARAQYTSLHAGSVTLSSASGSASGSGSGTQHTDVDQSAWLPALLITATYH